MTQEYTPVSWQDETTSQQGTLINAERLNQMQTAHHFADGLEEVDAVPTADPGVSYHKIVYCTADDTIYRWDGTQWTADIDDPTRELLEEHEADHDNPHQVTKAQVGLGNADNTSDADKPISTATQTALDTKLTQRFTTLAGKEFVYAYTRTQQTAIEVKKGMETSSIPIRDAEGAMHAQVPASPEATNVVNYGWATTELAKKADQATTYTKSETDTLLAGKADQATTLAGYGITDAYTKTETDTLLGAKADQATTYTKSEVNTALALKADKSDTYTKAEVQTYVSNALDGYTPMVRTTGNQTIAGVKTYTGAINAQSTLPTLNLQNTYGVTSSAPSSNYWDAIYFKDKNGANEGLISFTHYTSGVKDIFLQLNAENGAGKYFHLYANNDGTAYATAPTRGYNAGSAYSDDVATIGTLDAYSPMVRTTGAQTIAGDKTFDNIIYGTSVGKRIRGQYIQDKWYDLWTFEKTGRRLRQIEITLASGTFDSWTSIKCYISPGAITAERVGTITTSTLPNSNFAIGKGSDNKSHFLIKGYDNRWITEVHFLEEYRDGSPMDGRATASPTEMDDLSNYTEIIYGS